MKINNLALDVDGVLANFSDAAIYRAHALGLGAGFPSGWREVRMWNIASRFTEVMQDAWLSKEFWMGVNPMPNTRRDLVPAMYLTSRPIDSHITEAWLEKHGFQFAPVITVSKPEDKIAVLKKHSLFLVDDHHLTIESCVKEGIEAYLFKAPYQRGYDVSHLPTVTSLDEVVQKFEGENKTLAWRN